jgi:hypothetical protein
MATPPTRPVDPPTALLLRAVDRAEAGARAEAQRLAAAAEAAAPAAPAVHLAAAQIRFAVGDGEGALAALDRAEALDPVRAGTAQAWRAVLLRKQGRLAAALALLDALAARPAQAASAHAFAAEIRAGARDDEGALRHLDAALAAGAGGAALHLQRADLLARRGRDDDARAAIAAALAAEPADAARRLDAAARWIAVGAFADAEAALDAAATDPGARAAARAQLGRLRLFQGDLDAAATLAGEALAEDPHLALALCLRGALAVLGGEPAAALPWLDGAVAADEALHEAFVWRAEAHAGMGAPAAALEDLGRATMMMGDYFAAHVLRLLLTIRAAPERSGVTAYASESVLAGVSGLLPDGAAALATGDARVIEPLLTRALGALRGNRSPTVTTVRGEPDAPRLVRLPVPATPRFAAKWVLETLQVLPFPEVLGRFDAVLAAHPTSSKPWCYRGELRLWVGDLAGAREDFERARAVDETTRWAYIGLTATEMLEGRHAEALAAGARGLARAGEGPSLFVYRGEAHRRRGDLDAAQADLTRACAMNPSRVSAWVNLALLQGARGDDAGQRATLDRLAWQAPSLLHDAARALPSGPGAAALLDRCLAMMRGNRSSTCVTYFVGDELRIVPFVAREGDDGARRMLASVRASLLRRRG